jgi:hypothetical protein
VDLARVVRSYEWCRSEEGEIMLLTAFLACTGCVDWFLCYWYGYC